MLDRVVDFRSKYPNEKRIYGFGWALEEWGDGACLPTKEMIDAVSGDIPVYLQPAVAHFMWANTKALEESDITKNSVFPYGYAAKNENGELTGIVVEIDAETRMVCNAHSVPADRRKEITKPFLYMLAANGITSVGVISGETSPDSDFTDYAAYKELDEETDGGLPVRLNLIPSLGFSEDLSIAERLREAYSSDKVKVCALKQFMDGVPHIHTAFLNEPYTDDASTCGGAFNTAEVYNHVVAKANSLGFGVRIHCIGDAAVHRAIDAFAYSMQANGKGAYHNTIEHADIATDEDVTRAGKLGLVMSVQPSHLNLNMPIAEQRYGTQRRKRSYMYHKMLNAGAVLAFGTDFPCANLNPFETLYYASTRCSLYGMPQSLNPDQAVSLGESLHAYTYGSACALNREKELGTLEPDKLADLVVVDGPLFGETPAEWLNRKVQLTMTNGSVVYEKQI